MCEMEEVGGEVGAGNKNVIKIDKSEGEVAEDVIHESLKCLGSILEAKGHGEEFIEAKGCDDGSFWDIRGSNRNLIVIFNKVKLGENCGAMEPLRKVMEIGERVAVMDSLEIEAVIII